MVASLFFDKSDGNFVARFVAWSATFGISSNPISTRMPISDTYTRARAKFRRFGIKRSISTTTGQSI